MPTFTTIAWETLLEPGLRDSCRNGLMSQQLEQEQPSESSVVAGGGKEEEEEESRARVASRLYISPALYITPEPAPFPDSSSDLLSPSPYIVNHKRRGRFGEALERRSEDGDGNSNSKGQCADGVEELVDGEVFGGGDRNGISLAEDEEFLDPRCDSLSVASSTEVDDLGKQANQGEFFDADDDFDSDGSVSNLSSSYVSRIESELRAVRLSLQEEIGRRKAAESAVDQLCSQWQRLHDLLLQAGLTFPTSPNAAGMKLDIDSLEQFVQELVVARFVSEAIERGIAHAEVEMAAEAVINSKDQEIARLRDKLQYYEAANREMSQRNQEVMEVARKQRQKRRSKQRWIWGCLGLSVAIGASFFAYSYLPQPSKHHFLPSSGDNNASNTTTTESS